jgi:hypothetical protein
MRLQLVVAGAGQQRIYGFSFFGGKHALVLPLANGSQQSLS